MIPWKLLGCPGLSEPPWPSGPPRQPGPTNDGMAHKCNKFEYTLSRAGHFRAHLNIHSGEKSNTCNQCDYVFPQASSLWVHLNAHIGDRVPKKHGGAVALPPGKFLRVRRVFARIYKIIHKM